MGCAEPRVLSQGKPGIAWVGVLGKWRWHWKLQMGREDGWWRAVPEPSRAKGWLLLESRQGWKLEEFGECLRWREQQENQGAESFISSALNGSASTP